MQDLMNFFNIPLGHPQGNERANRASVSFHPQNNLLTGNMIRSMNAKEVGLLMVTNLELPILWNVDPFGAQTRLIFQYGNDEICCFRLQSQRLNPISVRFVMNK